MFNLREFLGLAFYVSPLDKFLKEYDQTHPELSLAKRQEMEKYSKIYALRDNPLSPSNKTDFWDKF